MVSIKEDLRGVFMITLTPFDAQGNQDLVSLARLVDFYLEAKVSGILALAEGSETDKLTQKEREENLEVVFKKVNGRVPVVVGANGQSARITVELIKMAQDKGASAVMVAPPKNPKLHDKDILDYYRTISIASDIPIVIQDFPEASHPKMTVSLLKEIAKLPNVKYLKLEDPPTPIKMEQLRQDGNPLQIFGALNGSYMLWELQSGAVGIMTSSPLPKYLVGIYNLYRSGQLEKATQLFYINLPLIHFYSQMTLSVKKLALKHKGIFRESKVRDITSELPHNSEMDLLHLMEWTERNSETIL